MLGLDLREQLEQETGGDSRGDENYSDCDPDFTLHTAFSESFSCAIDGCAFNFTGGTKVVLAYDRYIDPCACTAETTGWVEDLTVDIPYCPITYVPTATIDSQPMDGHTISAWGSFDLSFAITGAAGTNAFLGRFHVRIYGIDCADQETLVADYPGATWVVVLDGIACFPLERNHEVRAGGFYGPWTPDPLAAYKAYRVQVDLEPWTQIHFGGSITDPGTPPVHPDAPMASASFTVHIDQGLFACP